MNDFSRPLDLNGTPIGSPRVPELIRVPPAPPLEGVVTSSVVWELVLHWDGSRSRPCYGSAEECPHCGTAPIRRYGLIQLYDKAASRRVWVQLTEEAVEQVRLSLEHGLTLFGAQAKIGRARPTARARMWIKLEPGTWAPSRLGTPQEPHDTLARVFGSHR